MKTQLEPDHYKLADKVKLAPGFKDEERDVIAHFLMDRFLEEDKNFDHINWLKACGA